MRKDGDDWKEGNEQEYFLEIEYAGQSVNSEVINVNDSTPKIKVAEPAVSMTGVGANRESKLEKGECGCNDPVTEEHLKTIFPNATSDNLKLVAATYTKYMKDLEMNTCWNKAHLFAQARVEAGLALNMKDGEDFNYYYESLSIFGAFQTKEGKEKAKLWGRPTKRPILPGVSSENKIKIANYAYSPPAKKAKELENTEPNDGWNYRGRGLIQVTGKGFYKYCNEYTKKDGYDVVKKPDLIGQKIELAVLASMVFFKWKGINKIANGNKDVKGKICPKVGKDVIAGGKSNYEEKQKAFDEITSKIFKINECKLTNKKSNEQVKDSKVVITFGKNADKSVVSEKSLNLLREVGEQTKNYLITITSTARDPYNQARIMYDNIVKKGMKEQRNTYKEPGQRVLDAYESAKAKGKNKDGIIKEMEAKIKEIGPTKVSKHCGDPSIVNVFDVDQGMSNPKDFKKTITPKIETLLDENGCYHLEIKQ